MKQKVILRDWVNSSHFMNVDNPRRQMRCGKLKGHLWMWYERYLSKDRELDTATIIWWNVYVKMIMVIGLWKSRMLEQILPFSLRVTKSLVYFEVRSKSGEEGKGLFEFMLVSVCVCVCMIFFFMLACIMCLCTCGRKWGNKRGRI